MQDENEIVTSDLARFGSRELRMARDLLVAYCDPDANDSELLGSDVRIMMNAHSGNVFLCDEDYNVAMVTGGRLVDWVTCSWCGHEDYRDDFANDEDHGYGEHGETLCRGEGTYPPVDEDEDEGTV